MSDDVYINNFIKYTFSLKDIVYCICDSIDDPATLCKLAQVNKLFNKVVISLSYYKSCKLIYTEDKNNEQIWKDIVIKHGNLRLLKFLSPEINNRCLNYMFCNSCKHNQLKIAEWLIDYSNLIKSPIDIHIESELAFHWACAHEHLEVAKWLIKYSIKIKSPINIHIDDEYAFRISCRYGHIEVAKWLIEYSNSINSLINIHINNEYVFIKACKRGHLIIIEWLIKYANFINSPIDIHNNNEIAFCAACINDQLEIAKWLIEYAKSINSPIDIHIRNDLCFISSSNIIKAWLKTL